MTDKITNDANHTLRDARLDKALQHAPDASALPSPTLRNTIKIIATNAIGISAKGQLDAKNSWWRTWLHSLWSSTGSVRGPWGSALATLVLGCIISVMWYGQEMPDGQVRYSGAASEAVHPDVAAPAAPTAASAPTAKASAPTPMQERDTTTSPLTESTANEALPAAKVAAAPAQAPAPAAPATRGRSDELAAPQIEQRAASAAPQVFADNAETKDQATAQASSARREVDAPKRAAAQATGNAAPMVVRPSAAALAPAAASAAPPASVSASAPAPLASASAGALGKSRPAVPDDWHSARVHYQGHTLSLSAAQTKQLASYVMAVVNTATAQADTVAPAATAPMLRISFAGPAGDVSTEVDGKVASDKRAQGQAVFTLWSAAMQWQRAGQADVLGVPQADALAAVLAHVRSLP